MFVFCFLKNFIWAEEKVQQLKAPIAQDLLESAEPSLQPHSPT